MLNFRPSVLSPNSLKVKQPVSSQQLAISTSERPLNTPTKRKSTIPPNMLDCLKHHGSESKPAPTMLLLRLKTVDIILASVLF
mmetsp:Transcript_3793/g.5090  ORF Transcript_3793/g.5090 Transcript_3793/m.5090 type:complete len:83 (-) Transcript_3793:1086-1334(-)